MRGLGELTLRVAVLRIRRDQAADLFAAARAEAQRAYAELRRNGTKTLTPILPDATEAGTVTIKAGAVHVNWDEAAVFALVGECEPRNIEDWVDPACLSDPRVLDLLRKHLPALVVKRINPARRAELAEECIGSDGKLLNTESGDCVKVAEIVRADPTGEFAYIPGKKGKAAILAALRAGAITEDGRVAAGFAVPEMDLEPETVSGPAVAAESLPPDWPGDDGEVLPLGAPFADEHGFLNPVLAAAHACLVQGGFSTPPREAHRMIRDGGVGAERATRWLLAHGLDPADPRQGEDTPWPLPAPGPEPVAGEPGA